MVLSSSFQHDEVLGLKFGHAPIGKPSLYVHVYYVDGLLIDTGQRKAGKAIAGATGNLDVHQIFITHHHEDHSGNIPGLRKLHNCPVYAPEMTCEMMKDPPPISLAQQIVWGNREPYHELIPVGNYLETKNYHFELIHIPGHARDMVCLYEPTKKWLFSADLYINSYIGYYLKNESMLTQIRSTRKVLELDFELMFCAHNPQLNQAKEKLAKKLHFLESFFKEVSSLYNQGHSAHQIFKQLKLKENWFVRLLSGGDLSKMNMVKSVIRDLEKDTNHKV